MAEPCENCDTPELMVILYSARIENNQLATIFGDNWRLKNRDRAKKKGYFLTKRGGTFCTRSRHYQITINGGWLGGSVPLASI